MFLYKMNQGSIICNPLVFVVAFDLEARLFGFFVSFDDELVLIAVPQHVLDGCPKPCDVIGDAEGKTKVLDYLFYGVAFEDLLPIVGLAVVALELFLDFCFEDGDCLVIEVQVGHEDRHRSIE